MARMTIEEWTEVVEGAECTWENLSARSTREIGEVLRGERKEANVRDVMDADCKGTFTIAKLSAAWTGLARERGMSGIEFYESGEPDAVTYSEALEIAIFGEVVYA
jgi:hypothetical protein